jgi:hypothetical protein
MTRSPVPSLLLEFGNSLSVIIAKSVRKYNCSNLLTYVRAGGRRTYVIIYTCFILVSCVSSTVSCLCTLFDMFFFQLIPPHKVTDRLLNNIYI